MIKRLLKQIRQLFSFWTIKKEINKFIEQKPMLLIKRKCFNETETIGELYIKDKFFCYTLENPYLDNQPQISSIPAGSYYARRHESPKYGECFKVFQLKEASFVEPEGRSQILFHAGNFAKDTLGCILLGKKKYSNSIGDSAIAIKEFMNAMQGIDLCSLIIEDSHD